MNWYKESQDRYDHIPEENRNGDCFTKSYNYMMNNGMSGDLTLVHAIICPIMGPLTGVDFGHAWVEQGDKVIDTSRNNEVMDKQNYYLVAGLMNYPTRENKEMTIREDRIKTYSINELLEKEDGGPWNDGFDEYVLDE